MTSYDVKSNDYTNESVLYVLFAGVASLNKGVNTFERVQNSELSEKIIKIKLRKLQKIKLHITSFKFISF